jgi:hypothetical protein
MRRPVGGSLDPNGQGGRTSLLSCLWPDTNGLNQTRFKTKIRHAVGDALISL